MITRKHLYDMGFVSAGKELHLKLQSEKRCIVVRGTWMFFVESVDTDFYLDRYRNGWYISQLRLHRMWYSMRQQIGKMRLVDVKSIIDEVKSKKGYWYRNFMDLT